MQRSTGQVIAHGREVSLTRPELGVLELLLRSGSDGVTPEAIKAAAGDGAGDPDAIVAQLRRKTGVRGRGQGVRKERVLLYFLGEDEAEPTSRLTAFDLQQIVSRSPCTPAVGWRTLLECPPCVPGAL